MKQVINHADEGVHPELEQLGSKDEAERWQARAAIDRLGPRAVEELTHLLSMEAIKRRKAFRRNQAFSLASSLAIWLVYRSTVGYNSFNILMFIATFVGIRAVANTSARAKSAAKALLQYDDPRAIGPLAEMLTTEDAELRGEIRRALLKLLPEAPMSLRASITVEQTDCLNKALTAKDPELELAILKGLHQFGTGRSLLAVRTLAQGEDWEVWSNSGRGPRSALRQAAVDLVPILESVAREEALRDTLLRPASSPDSPDQVLLRPVGPSTNIDETQLLRPAQPE